MTASESDDQTRVGNPERERAIGLLNDALTEGYLDIHEFDERAAVVYAARTRGELRELLVHLPGDDRLFPNLASPVGPGSPVDSPSFVEFDINWKTVTRKGSWQVPARILVAGSMGTANLDLSGAHFAQSDVAIEVQISASSVKVLLGSDQSVVTDDLVFTSWSSIRNRPGPRRSGPDRWCGCTEHCPAGAASSSAEVDQYSGHRPGAMARPGLARGRRS